MLRRTRILRVIHVTSIVIMLRIKAEYLLQCRMDGLILPMVLLPRMRLEIEDRQYTQVTTIESHTYVTQSSSLTKPTNWVRFFS